ncbi:MAG: bifunctional phosphoribosylaminoimidazolecarboxamide formyltransferase/IMP cyclohydrolase [Candidatus Solibacter usitatus]|nr:bifunctional phosphoribosylaminoimidazolecarboxamide formyltransferase/IMP cyclohydrolase [Candidatus Solibacter usitatus]
MPAVKRALLSVTDKSGLLDFAKGLAALGCELISTGGTAKMLRDSGLDVKDVSEVTGFPEMLDGRVKTIHPRIAAGLLARRGLPEHMAALAEHGIGTIDMVVVNLYEFEKIAAKKDAPVEELIENIDIGGPTMIRAAAKNFEDVAVVTSAADYPAILAELQAGGGTLSRKTHWDLARKAYATTARYDAAITARLASIEVENAEFVDRPSVLPRALNIHVPRRQELRYGENPHQAASLYACGAEGIANCTQLHGKELSYNNLVDLDAAWLLVCEFDGPAASIIKHTNPCGCAEQSTLVEAYRKAFEADTVSAFGGVLAFNREVDEDTAAEVSKLFVEAVAAPAYSQKALSILAAKKNLRLVTVKGKVPEELVVKSIGGGFLAQSADSLTLDSSTLKVVTERQPTAGEWAALEFGWKVSKHVKSNAIVYARAGQLLSSGAGQMSRVFSAEIGAKKSVLPLEGCAVASDAFFPFADGLEVVVKNGGSAVIQPGGSVKDDEVIAAANRLGITMVFTGLRHFRH